MIRSMTAFSRKELNAPWGTLSWELRSVNHRYLEVHPRLPDTLRDLENPVRESLRSTLSRGKVECTLKLKAENLAPTRLEIRRTLAELDGWNQGVLNSGRFLFDTMHRLAIAPTEEDRAQWRHYNELARSVRGACVIDLPLDFTGGAVGNRWSYEVEE